jgi:hypothetical protein
MKSFAVEVDQFSRIGFVVAFGLLFELFYQGWLDLGQSP